MISTILLLSFKKGNLFKKVEISGCFFYHHPEIICMYLRKIKQILPTFLLQISFSFSSLETTGAEVQSFRQICSCDSKICWSLYQLQIINPQRWSCRFFLSLAHPNYIATILCPNSSSIFSTVVSSFSANEIYET